MDRDLLQETTALLGDLIAFPSVSETSNLAIIGYLADRLESVGARVDVQETGGGKANLFATLGPGEDDGIVLSGHSDVVPVADQDWTADPFTMVARDDRLFGRGSCDMKGFIAACIAMAPRFATQDLRRPLHFAFTHDEETGCIGAGHLVRFLKEAGIRPRVAVIGEPTSMRVIEGHKGCHEYSTHLHGLAGHGSQPDLGVNAVEYAVRYVHRLLELKAALRHRAPPESRFDPPWTTVNVGALHGGVAHNVIAPFARVNWEMRPVTGSDADYVKSSLAEYCETQLLPAMRAVSPDARIDFEVVGEVAGLQPMAANEALSLVAELTGSDEAGLVAFGTEAGIFQSLGMDVVVCGPGSIAQAHKADEFVALDQLDKCLQMLSGLGQKLVD